MKFIDTGANEMAADFEKKDPNGFHLKVTPTEKAVIESIAKFHGLKGGAVIMKLLRPALDEYIVLAKDLHELGLIGNNGD